MLPEEALEASSGSITVHPMPTDVGELLRQSVGEYEDRFAASKLTPVLNLPTEPLVVMGDGRLLWRVFDNLLNNICKYSQTGTRVYLDASLVGSTAHISMKNISRDYLNVTADALVERFVRGDSSRTSEGSGLGLSIAQSLTELQGGAFKLFVDGDLFKAVLDFPLARKSDWGAVEIE